MTEQHATRRRWLLAAFLLLPFLIAWIALTVDFWKRGFINAGNYEVILHTFQIAALPFLALGFAFGWRVRWASLLLWLVSSLAIQIMQWRTDITSVADWVSAAVECLFTLWLICFCSRLGWLESHATNKLPHA